MDTRQIIIQELESVPDEVLVEVLDFLRFLLAKEDKVDLEDSLAALEEAAAVGTTSLHDLKRELGM
ncbi:hypothetical protein A6770_36915 [Nostoc minutum NIES-26]|uniref:DUF2281 domain-containing protein n=1 Tax=Nostoc minutum NIES-26 TaxID=1844469 RepID=A0A367RZ02_9NOSO|nr:hypothetical protein A6770_36915 [Nostoc minutum NIES-26]